MKSRRSYTLFKNLAIIDLSISYFRFETTIIYLIFKRINPATSIVVSNLKYDIDKSIIAKFLNNVKDLLDYMFSN